MQAQLEAAHAATASAAADASRAQHEARAAAAQLAAAGAERDAAQAELRQLTHMYQQHLATQREEMAAVVAANSAAHTPNLVGELLWGCGWRKTCIGVLGAGLQGLAVVCVHVVCAVPL